MELEEIIKATDDNDVDTSSSSSSSPPALPAAILPMQTTFVNSNPTEELINELVDMGFDGALDLVLKYGYDRVKAARDRALSRPAGTIKNLPGYIRYLCKTKGAIPAPNGDKYTTGKYQRMVKR